MPAAPPPLSPRAARTRARLLDGCAAAIAAHGLREVTVEQVVVQAGLSRRTFYAYFPDKDAVLLGLYTQLVDTLITRIAAAVDAAPDPLARLHAAIDTYLDIQQSGGPVVAELQAEAANPASALWHQRQRAVDELVHLTDRELQAIGGGTLDLDVFAMLFHGLESLVIQRRKGGDLDDAARAQVQAVVRGTFLATLAAAQHLPKR